MFTRKSPLRRRVVRRPHREVFRNLESLEVRQLLAVAPVAIRDSYQGQALQQLSVPAASGVLANDTYEGTGTLQAWLVDAPAQGQLSLAVDGSFTYQTIGNYGGRDQFSYRVVADGLQSDKVVVALQLTQQPDLPVAVNDRYLVHEDETLVADAVPRRRVDSLPVGATDLVYDPTGDRVYALVAGGVVEIDPETQEAGALNAISGVPFDITISDDGHYIYAALSDGRRISRFNTQQNAVDLTWDITDYSGGGLAVTDFEAVPGRPTALAVAQFYVCCSPRQGGIVVFDNGVGLPASTAGGLGTSYGGDTIVFGRDDILVGYTNSLSSYDLNFLTVDATGVHWQSGAGGILVGNTSIRGGGGYIYTDGGAVIQVDPLQVIGDLPHSGPLLADPAGNRVFVVHGSGANTTLSWYNPGTLTELGQLPLPEVTDEVLGLTRMGADGVALYTRDGQVILVRSDLISGVTRRGVLTNDADPEHDVLTPSLITNVQHGQLTWNGDGTFRYQPNRDFFGTDTFTYRVSDGTHPSNIGTVTIQVRAVNDAPSGAVDNYVVMEDAVLTVPVDQGVLTNDVDVDSPSFTASLVAPPTHGQVTLEWNGSFRYTPHPDFHGEDVFAYTAFDGQATSLPIEVHIQVNPDNGLAIPVDDVVYVNEDSTLRLDGTPTLSVLRVDQPAADLATDPSGQHLFVAVPGLGSVTEDTVLALDPYNGALRAAYAIGRNPTEMVVSDDGRYLYTVIEDERAIRVYDLVGGTLGARMVMPGGGDSAERVRNVHAIPGHPDRLLVSRYYRGWSPPAGGNFVYTQDGSILPRHVGLGVGTGGPDLTTVDETGTLAYGYQNSVSSFDFWFMELTDSGVEQVDFAPWGSLLSGYGIGRIEVAGGRLFTDLGHAVDLETRTEIGTFQGGQNFVLDPAAGKLFSLATAQQTTTLYVYDISTLNLLNQVDIPGVVGSTSSLVRFGPDGVAFRTTVNNQPGAIYLVQSTAVAGFASQGVLDNDRDVDVNGLHVELVSPPGHGSLSLGAAGSVVYQPAAEYSGNDAFVYRLVVGNYVSPPATVSIVVRPVNDSPIANGESYRVDEDTRLTVDAASGLLANDRDVEASALKAKLTTPPLHGTLELADDGSFTYQPAVDFFGVDQFEYVASDGFRNSTPVTVPLTVSAMPDATVGQPDTYVVDQARTLIADATKVVVTQPTVVAVVPAKSVWRYLDDGSDQGTAWCARILMIPAGMRAPDNWVMVTVTRRPWSVVDPTSATGM